MPPAPASLASSLLVLWLITSIARRSLRPVLAAWPLWTQKSTSTTDLVAGPRPALSYLHMRGDMLTWLKRDDLCFPPLEAALREPNGLLAAGGDLSHERLLAAYRHGCFPWYQ